MHGYKHVVNVEFCPAVLDSDGPSFEPGESARGKAAAQDSPSSTKAAAYHEMLEGIDPLVSTARLNVLFLKVLFQGNLE